MKITGINELWVSDITYWKVSEKYLYVSLITDAYSHKIIGYHLAETLESVETIKALKMAIGTLPENLNHSLTHHSDRGVQYCSEAYVNLLQDKQIAISMTENGDPLENAVAERVNGILKQEYLRFCRPINKKQARAELDRVITLYNGQRPHFSIGLLTPELIHSKKLVAEKLWKNYYVKKDNIVNSLQDYKQSVNT